MSGDCLIGLLRIPVIVFVFLFVCKVQTQSLPERLFTVSVCYSDTNQIRLNCSSEEIIAVDAVYAGAKLISTSCMSAADIVNTTSPNCCVRDYVNDCIATFVNQDENKMYEYHHECTGREECGPIPVQWMSVSPEWCTNHTNYRQVTGYLAIDYYCIKNTSLGVLPEVSLSTGSKNAIYLQGQQSQAQKTNVSCSLEVTCGAGINIQAIYIDFDRFGRVCQQEVVISDNSGHTKVITCDDNDNYTITEVYRTSSDYVKIHISSQHGHAKFLMGFVPISGGSLSLSCPAVPHTVGKLCTSTSATPTVHATSTTANVVFPSDATITSNAASFAATNSTDNGRDRSQSLPEQLFTVSVCYSNANQVGLSCASGEIIAVDSVYAGAKLISTSCMSAADIVNTTSPNCCVRDYVNDCIATFVNQDKNKMYEYHHECTGREECGPIPVQWMSVSPEWCTNYTYYRQVTGYLAIDYYCIKNTSVGILPRVSLNTSSNNAIYLQGQQNSSYMGQSTDVICSLEETCGGGISIQAIYIGFDRVGGVCQQKITISDNSGHTKVITCVNNNKYNITEVYRTSLDYVKIHISSQHGHAQFLMGFVPTHKKVLKLSCPAVPRQVHRLCTLTSAVSAVSTSTNLESTTDAAVTTTADATGKIASTTNVVIRLNNTANTNGVITATNASIKQPIGTATKGATIAAYATATNTATINATATTSNVGSMAADATATNAVTPNVAVTVTNTATTNAAVKVTNVATLSPTGAATSGGTTTADATANTVASTNDEITVTNAATISPSGAVTNDGTTTTDALANNDATTNVITTVINAATINPTGAVTNGGTTTADATANTVATTNAEITLTNAATISPTGAITNGGTTTTDALANNDATTNFVTTVINAATINPSGAVTNGGTTTNGATANNVATTNGTVTLANVATINPTGVVTNDGTTTADATATNAATTNVATAVSKVLTTNTIPIATNSATRTTDATSSNASNTNGVATSSNPSNTNGIATSRHASYVIGVATASNPFNTNGVATESKATTGTLIQETDTGSTTIIIAVVVASLLLLILLALILLCCWKYKKRKVAPEETNINDDSNNGFEVLSTIPFSASTAPWATAVTGGKKLPPIRLQADEANKENGHKKKKKKRKRRKKRKTEEEKAFTTEEIGQSNGEKV